MIKILKFNIELTRKRFSIYGLFNIFSLILVLFSLLFGIKLIQYKIYHYDTLSIVGLVFIYVLFSKYIIPNNCEKNILKVKTYFNLLDSNAIEKYYKSINLISFYIVIIFFLFPTHINDINSFSLYFLLINLLLFIQLFCKKILNSNKYLSVTSSINITLICFTFLYMKKFIVIPIDKLTNNYTMLIYLFISLYLIVKNFKMIDYNKTNITTVYFFSLSKKIFKLFKNKDLILIIRKNLLINPILLILLSNLYFRKLDTTDIDLFITCILSFTCSFIGLYIDLLKHDEDKMIIFYNPTNFKKFKFEKIINTIYISVFILILVVIPLTYLLSLKTVLLSYLLSIVIFLISSLLIKLNLQRTLSFKIIITNKEVLYLFIIATLSSLSLNFIL